MITIQTAERNIKLQRLINLFAGFLFLTPVVTLLYKYTGLGLVEITLIANAATLCNWLFELPTSIFADVSGLKKSLLYSVICNFIGALLLFLFPGFWGFIAAAVFAALYWSFWSGTGQAFLETNLRVLGKEKSFGRVISGFMIIEQFAGLICPLIASGVLFFFHEEGYRILAGMDIIGATVLVALTFRLKEVTEKELNLVEEESRVRKYFRTAKMAFMNVLTNKDIRTLLIFRTFGNHISYLPLVIFPVLTDAHMPSFASGIISALATAAMMYMLKFGNNFSEKYSYGLSWIIATIIQSLILCAAAFFLHDWVILAGIYIIFVAFDGLWQPAWNQVLVNVVGGKAIATTRSLIFSIFALYTTVGKQVLSFLPLSTAFVCIALVVLATNILYANKIMQLNIKEA
ncbi:MAG: MFS transporter [Candidatus Gracilibacteria bacterium]